MTDDLFAAFADELAADPTPSPALVDPEPEAWPGQPVASFACHCGARDEILEPAPASVDCWSCKAALAMSRWTPLHRPPSGNARRLTDAERGRL